jgi:hypothetical protein
LIEDRANVRFVALIVVSATNPAFFCPTAETTIKARFVTTLDAKEEIRFRGMPKTLSASPDPEGAPHCLTAGGAKKKEK